MSTPELGGLGTRLPPEIIELVVEQLALSPGPDPDHARSGRHALATLMRVSHTFYDIIGPVLYSRIVLTRNNADALFYGFERSEGVRKTKYVYASKQEYQAEFDKFRDLFLASGGVDDGPEEADNLPGRHYSELERCSINLTARWRQGKPMPEDCGEYGNPFEDYDDSEESDGSEEDEYTDSDSDFDCSEGFEESSDSEAEEDAEGEDDGAGEHRPERHNERELSDYESLSETDDDVPSDYYTPLEPAGESFERKKKLLGFCRVLHVVQLPHRHLLRDLSKVSWSMNPEHVIVSSRAVLRALKSDVYRSSNKLGFEADDFLAKLFDFARHTCITWPSKRAPTVEQMFRFVRKTKGVDGKVIQRLRASAENWSFDSFSVRYLRLRGNATFHGFDSAPMHSLYATEASEKRYFSKSQCRFDSIRTEGQSLTLSLNETAPAKPAAKYDTFEFISIGDIDLEKLKARIDPYTTAPNCLSYAVDKLERSRDVLQSYLENRASASPAATEAAAEADLAYRSARIRLRELEEYPDIHEELFGRRLRRLYGDEWANFPLTSERIKITHVDDADPCAACGRKDFEEEANLHDLVATTQRIPLMTGRKRV